MAKKARVLVLADVPTWAWARKARAYQEHLHDQFDITVAYHAYVPDLRNFDLIHLFEVSQIGILTAVPKSFRPFKAVAGLTAHVWRTWGAARMAAWANEVDALHGNSRLLEADLHQFHHRVFYTPNGVDEKFWHRYIPRDEDWNRPFVIGHVGKPNPRKGGVFIIEAARKLDLEIRSIQRTAKVAMKAEEMLEWYQGIDVQVTCSNMDGTPNPMLEAAACACSLISTPIGNMPEFIESGVNGILIPPLPGREQGRAPVHEEWADVEKMEQGLLDALIYLRDHRDAQARMARAARATVEAGWTWREQVRYVAHMWQTVLDG